MEFAPIPAFLNKGTFLPDALGYRYSEQPPIDLLSPAALLHPDPWIVLAAVLEHGKTGNFSHVTRLQALIDPDGDPFLSGVTLQLLGDIGTEDAVRTLLAFMNHESDVIVARTCKAALHSGYLWLVAHFLEAWKRVKGQDEKQTISLVLSALLEEDRGPISSPEDFSEKEYVDRIHARAGELNLRYATDTIPIWAGNAFSVVGIAKNMLRILKMGLKEGFSLYADFLGKRERFEATTGIDCSSFYTSKRVHVSATIAILAQFLDSEEPKRYKDGLRYFFGHEVPAPRPIYKS